MNHEDNDNFVEPEEKTAGYISYLKTRGYDMRRLSTLGKMQPDSKENTAMKAEEQLNKAAKPDPSDGFLFAEFSENAPRFMAPLPLDCKQGLSAASSSSAQK